SFAVGGTRCPLARRSNAKAAQPVAQNMRRWRMIFAPSANDCAIALRTRRSTFHLATLASFVSATDQPASLGGFFSGVLVLPGGGPFVDSFGVEDFSPPDEVAGASFLAASL